MFGRAGWVLGATLAVAACSPQPSPPSASDTIEFQGSWTAAGSRHTVQLGGDRRASVSNLDGTLWLSGPSRPGRAFRMQVLALNDSATGMVGRAVWTDDRGDQAYSELKGDGDATGNRIVGTLLGGTGRYAGATGGYTFSWRFVIEADEGQVQGQSQGFQGHVRLGEPTAQTPNKP